MRRLLVFLFMCSGGWAMSWSAWTACIQTAWSNCPLDAGTYQVAGPLYPAVGVTMSGSGTSNYSTVLQRPSGAGGYPLINITASSVAIYNLTIDGNRYSFPNAQTGCGSNQTEACGPAGAYGCTGATGANNGQTYDIVTTVPATIDQVAMWNSAGVTPLYMSGGTIEFSSFYYGNSNGPWLTGAQFADVHDNAMQYNGTAGIRFSGTAGANLQRTSFFENRYEMPDGAGGGQIYIDYGAQWVYIFNNTVDGNNWVAPARPTQINGCYGPDTAQGVSGIEVEPASTKNKVYGNEVTRNTGSGISVHSATSLYLSGYNSDGTYKYIHDNTGNAPPFNRPTLGIEFLYTSYGSSTGITLDRILSKNNSGDAVSFQFDSGASGPGWSGNHCLLSSYTTSWNLTQPTPASTTTCP